MSEITSAAPLPVPGAEAAHPEHLQHHFETPAQQFDASKLGMWLFLATEVLFFSGLFCAYAVYRRNHPEIFEVGHRFLDVKWGAINTIVLITSSFTMALAVWCAQKSKRTGLITCLVLTFLGACTFMGIKYIEYDHKIRHGIMWGTRFDPQPASEHGSSHAAAEAHKAAGAPVEAPHAANDAASAAATAAGPAGETGQAPPATDGAKIERWNAQQPPVGLSLPVQDPTGDGHEIDPYAAAREMRNAHIFFGIYFAMTGLHGLHVLAGMIVIAWLIIGAVKGRYNSEYYTPVDLGGLYWHLVDLVWIYLFPLLYLIH